MQEGRKRRSHRSRGARLSLRKSRRGRAGLLSRVLALAGGALALAAVVLLISYLVQGHQTRQEQERQRALFRSQEAAAAQEAGDAESLAQQAALEQPPGAAQAAADPAADGEIPAQQEQQGGAAAAERQVMDDRFLPLMRRNNDTVGWLSYSMIPEIDYAVVQKDNDYYMYRGFTGEKNVAGTVFLDQSNSIRPRDNNLILHGHNMKNGTMFGKLQKLLDPVFLKTQPIFTFDTLYQDAAYVPYALTIFSVNPDNPLYFDIIKTNFEEAEAMGQYVNWLREHSALSFPTQVYANDRLLSLVTCHGTDEDERLVLALRALRPGEDAEALKAAFAAGVLKP